MKKPLLVLLALVFSCSLVFGQVTLTIDGQAVNRADISITTGTVQPTPTPVPTPPTPTPVPQPQPSGIGSKTDPIRLNKLSSFDDNGYIAQQSPDGSRGTIGLKSNSILWFEIDPFVTRGRHVDAFAIDTKFYNAAFSVLMCRQNRNTGTCIAEVSSGPPTGFMRRFYGVVDTEKYLFGIQNPNNSDFTIDVWAIIP